MPQITEWVSGNLTAVSELYEGWNGDKGVIALHDDYVEEMGLPRALRYPHNDNYGVYLLQSFHNMHCLVCHSFLLRYFGIEIVTCQS